MRIDRNNGVIDRRLFSNNTMSSEASQQIRATLVHSRASVGTPVLVQRQGWEDAVSAVSLPADVTVTPADLDGVPGEWIECAAERPPADVILLLHGGGYSQGSSKTHRELAARLARLCAARVVTIDYRLAPEFPFPAALEDTVAAYGGLLASGISADSIVIAGDSAGGGLAMATLLMLRDAGVPLPLATVLLSPWADLSLSGSSMESRAELDPLVSRTSLQEAVQYYLGAHDPRDPLASPVYATLQHLPPMLIQAGDHEVLLSDATRLAEHAQQAGVIVQLEVWEEMWHVWHAWAQDLPEARDALAQVAQFLDHQRAKR